MSQHPVILLGAGGHAKVVLDLLRANERTVIGVCDPNLARQNTDTWRGVSVLGDDSAIYQYAPDSVELANGMGSLPGSQSRRRLHLTFSRQGYRFATLVHPSAVLGVGVTLDQGVQVMAGCVIQADTCIDEGTIINTAAQIDHDGQIGSHVHIAPGAVLSGEVTVEENAHIGPNATLIQGKRIGKGAIVGAGTTVLRDIFAYHQLTGQPPREPQPLQRPDQEAEI